MLIVKGKAGHMQSSFVWLLLFDFEGTPYQHAAPSSKHQALSLTHDSFLIRNYYCFLKLNKKHNLSYHVACHPSHQHAPPSSKHQALLLTHDFFLIRNYYCSLKLNKKHNLSNHVACHPSQKHAQLF